MTYGALLRIRRRHQYLGNLPARPASTGTVPPHMPSSLVIKIFTRPPQLLNYACYRDPTFIYRLIFMLKEFQNPADMIFNSLRGTITSMNPCSSKNSERWNPGVNPGRWSV
jgi:hypothetical protein